jgi:putative phage-type endonuclease
MDDNYEENTMEIEHERHGRISVTDHVYMLIEKDRLEWTPQRTEPWYAKRRQHLTASSIASICGDNPYETRMTALKKKVGHEAPFTGNAATAHGNKYEDEAILKYEKLTGEKVIEFGLLESINPNQDHLAGSPDGITASGRLIEVKCPFRRKPNGEVPKHYVHQIQTLMHILNLDVCDFIEYVPAGTWTAEIFTIVTVTKCDVFWERVEPLLIRFWEDVQTYRVHGQLPREEPKEKTKQVSKRKPRVITIEPPEKKCLIKPPQQYMEESSTTWTFPGSFIQAVEQRSNQKQGENDVEENNGFGKCMIKI